MKRRYVYSVAVTVLTAAWLCWLQNAAGFHAPYYAPYWVVGLGGIWCAFRGRFPENLGKLSHFWLILGTAVFSFAVALANYNILPDFAGGGTICVICGFAAAYPIFLHFAAERPKKEQKKWKDIPFLLVFCGTVAVVCIVNLVILYNCYYPGILTYDSIWQMNQITSGEYSNHHPFYHTQIIRLFYMLGMALFDDSNKAIFLYNVFQILAMGSVFGFVMMTLAQRKVPVWVLGICLIWYACMPYHVMYSFTVWKDVLWAGMVTVFLTCLYRMFYGMLGGKWNAWLLALSAMGVCLLRSNGWFVFAIVSVLFGIFFGRKYRKTAICFVIIAIISWVLKDPVLDNMGVTQPDTIESLSIPTQMIARVVDKGLPLTEEEYTLLSQVVEVERIPDNYVEYISDSMKELVREKDNQQAITENAWAYFKLWIGLGLRYPETYVEAWVEQTKGYWNAGYEYTVWVELMGINDLGLYTHIVRPAIRHIWERYLALWRPETTHLKLFISVGFQTWIAAGVFLVSLAKRKWKSAFLAVPLLGIVASLMVATPVFCEFRYAYAFFTSVPVLLLGFFTEERT